MKILQNYIRDLQNSNRFTSIIFQVPGSGIPSQVPYSTFLMLLTQQHNSVWDGQRGEPCRWCTACYTTQTEGLQTYKCLLKQTGEKRRYWILSQGRQLDTSKNHVTFCSKIYVQLQLKQQLISKDLFVLISKTEITHLLFKIC